jgi:ArsR family transcriptional regulator, virulence genes transcriptional regulator
MKTALPIDTNTLNGGAKVLRALNNRYRQTLVKFIHSKQRVNVTTIYKKLGWEQSVASQYLRILREEGFVNTEREGKKIYYSLNYKRFAGVDRLVKNILK